MVTAVITDSVPLCFGTCCEQHAQCRRYTAVDGSMNAGIAGCGSFF